MHGTGGRKALWIITAVVATLIATALPAAAQSGGANEGDGEGQVNSLEPFYRVRLAGDYAAAGVGMRDVAEATITLNSLPTDSKVTSAFLYWATLAVAPAPNEFARGRLNGHRIQGELIGTGPDTCWDASADTTFVYRADVTGLVAGNGNYTLSRFPASQALMEGASLVVIYLDAGATEKRDVVIYDGADVIEHGNFSVGTEMAIRSSEGGTAKTTYIVADGQDAFSDTTWFNGELLATDPTGTGDSTGLEGSDGGLWDTDTYDVSDLVAAGDQSIAVELRRGSDCIAHVAQVFSNSA